MNSRALKIVVAFVVCVLIVELVLRFAWGFGTPALYIEDADFEYMYAPNQDIKRFGNTLITNEFSMRSKPLSDKDNIRILKFGDSVINGGTPTDQDSLASTLLENKLSKEYAKNIRVLNISAGSWGPDNAAAYLKKYGDFNCNMIVLVFSSHDLYDCMGHEKIVGENVNYPNKKPFSAIGEVFNRYFLPWAKEKLGMNELNYAKLDANQISTVNANINSGWNFFIDYCKQKNIPLCVILHPTVNEIANKQYNKNGQKIIAMLDSTKTPYVLELNNPIYASMYRDNIHFNNKGQAFLADEEYPIIKNMIDNYSNARKGN